MSIESYDHFLSINSDATKMIHEWISKTLSIPNKNLNGLPPCPYAKEAVLNNEISIFYADKNIEDSVEHTLNQFDSFKKRAVILSCPPSSLSSKETSSLVKKLREKFYTNNLWLMYDHPDIEESVADMNFSFEHSLLFFFQKLDDLTIASQALYKKGYYKNWPEEYFNAVFSKREDYFKKATNKLNYDS